MGDINGDGIFDLGLGTGYGVNIYEGSSSSFLLYDADCYLNWSVYIPVQEGTVGGNLQRCE